MLQALRSCKSDGLLCDSLSLNFARGSKFQILEWAGDRHLKSLLASHALMTFGRLKDEDELSEVCSRFESNASLARVFDETLMHDLVDEGLTRAEQVGDATKRKADVIEAVIAELVWNKGQGDVRKAKNADETLIDLVSLIFRHGDKSHQDIFPKPVLQGGPPFLNVSSNSSASALVMRADDPPRAEGDDIDLVPKYKFPNQERFLLSHCIWRCLFFYPSLQSCLDRPALNVYELIHSVIH